MKIWYMNGYNKTSIEAEVVAKGAVSYFIRSIQKSVLMAIPEHMVVAKLYTSSSEVIPHIVEFILKNRISDVDYSVSDRVNVVH